MKLYLLGPADWADTQLSYHALAGLGREGLVLTWPREPYVCLGYHQDLTQELDLAHLRRANIPVFRREVGGGAVYLDQGQLFWQLVLRAGHPLVTLDRQRFYRRFLEPVIAAYRALGVAAEFKPVNDVVVGGRKICGTGAGEIGECAVFVGNLMRSFDCAAMASVLAAPSEGFRRRFLSAMETNLTSLERELGHEAAAELGHDRLCALLAEGFAALLGGLPPADADETARLRAAMAELRPRMLSPDWLRFRRKPRPDRRVKVRAGLFLHHRRGAADGGDLEVEYAVDEGRLSGVSLTGPADRRRETAGLARALEGQPLENLAGRLSELAPGEEADRWREMFGV